MIPSLCDTLSMCDVCRYNPELLNKPEVCPKGWRRNKLPGKEAKQMARDLINYKKKYYPCCNQSGK